MKQFIKKVATGPKGNEDLSFEEAQAAMNDLLDPKVSDVEKASFLVGWRLKPETNDEYRGALSAIYQKTVKIPLENTFELGFPFDGKNNSPYLFPLVGKLLKSVGVTLVVTGDERIPAKEGITVKMLHDKISHMPLSENYRYFDRKTYLPELSELSTIRNQIGLRTALNTLEKFSKVSESSYAGAGVFHKPYVEKYSKIFCDHLNGFLLLGGNEGTPELAKKSKYWIVKGDTCEEYILDPEEFGVKALYTDEDLHLDQHVQMLLDPDKNMLKMACLNAALYLKVMNTSTKIEENFEIFNKLI